MLIPAQPCSMGVGSPADPSLNLCLHHLVEQQASIAPDAMAVVHGAHSLTYQDLNQQANQIAHYLHTLGIGPDCIVGLCLPRSLDVLVALLGILKAGGAYLPLDPSYPAERLAMMLEQAQVPVLLTHSTLQDRFPAGAAHTICLDQAWTQIGAYPTSPRPSAVNATNLLYVIYTSGSTGVPKGIAMPHRSLVNLIQWQIQQRSFGRDTRTVQFTPLSFDVSCQEIFSTWAAGGTLVVIDETTRRDPLALLRFLDAQAMTCLFLPFVALQRLSEAAERGSVPAALREVITAGEQLQVQPALVRFFERLPDCRLHNQYGPAETHVVTQYTLTGPPATWPALPPIGYPLPNCTAYIMDEQCQPVLPGEVGELYLGGIAVARGYLHRPDLTAEKFIRFGKDEGEGGQDSESASTDRSSALAPVIPHPASRILYKTGDMAQLLPDGAIAFLGRIDHQVKIRGIRVELGEIEVVLSKHPAVAEAVVVARDDAPGGGKWLVAYVVPVADADPASLMADLQGYLAQSLPDHMRPTRIVPVAQLPLTPSGKVDRRSLPAPSTQRPALATPYAPPRTPTEQRLAAVWQEVLQLDAVGLHDNFFDLGGHSLLLVQVRDRLVGLFGDDWISATDLFQYPTIQALAGYLDGGASMACALQTPDKTVVSDIAVIGMACRFPGAHDPDSFWQNLCDGVESITFFADHELEVERQAWMDGPEYVKARGILADIDQFDARFFGLSDRDASMLDPQQRLFLECAWETLEQAGYHPDGLQAPVGVFAGTGLNTYFTNNLLRSADHFGGRTFIETARDMQTLVSSDKDYLPTRVAYTLNLTGPAVNVQTACSTALVALHLACQSLRMGECGMALVGAASVSVPQQAGYLYQPDMMFAPDGHCRAFDAQAQGTVFGNGVGVVLLKPLDAALSDGDTIYAVVKGTAINNDGAQKVGYTAPSVAGQAAVIAAAQTAAGVNARSIRYVEAHGTGTTLGDPIEVAGLTQAFRQHTTDTGFCAIGSVKSNIGHLATAAGMAGLIKTVLALHHRHLPATLHVTQPNPRIDFAASPFVVLREGRAWDASDGTPRRAGVSAFGFGGTNAHAILEEAPSQLIADHTAPENDQPALLALSAHDDRALQQLARRYVAWFDQIEQHPISMPALSYTTTVGRRHFARRLALVAPSPAEMRAQLGAWLADPAQSPGVQWRQEGSSQTIRRVAFLFSGQGSQYAGMGRMLYASQPVFRQTIDQCAELLQDELAVPLVELLFQEDHAELLNETHMTQPALFALEYALAQLWLSWGIEPDALIGHSVGEYVAACLAGVFSLADGLRLIAARGRLMQALPRNGLMLAVQTSAAQVEAVIAPYPHQVAIAALNAPQSVVISGQRELVEQIGQELVQQGIKTRPLTTSHAFHSPLMEPMLEAFAQIAARITFYPPQRLVISNVSGQPAGAEIATPDYWVQHVRQPVRFADGVRTMHEQGISIFLELGPKPTLLGLVQTMDDRPPTMGMQHNGADSIVHRPSSIVNPTLLPSLRPGQPELQTLLMSLGQLYVHAVPVNWAGVHAGTTPRRIALPTYPFQRRRYWIDPAQSRPETRLTRSLEQSDVAALLDLLRTQPDIAPEHLPAIGSALSRLVQQQQHEARTTVASALSARPDWLYRVQWQPLAAATPGSLTGHWLIVADREGIGAALARRLHQSGASSELWLPGDPKPQSRASYQGIVFLRGLGLGDIGDTAAIAACYGELLTLVQASIQAGNPPRLWLVTRGAQVVQTGDSVSGAAQAVFWGLGRVLLLEHPELRCTCLDIAPSTNTESSDQAILMALQQAVGENQLALRGGTLYAARLEQLPAPTENGRSPHSLAIQPDASYLISGGTGGVGQQVARWLVARGARNLVLNGRSGTVTPEARQCIADLEQQGATVQVVAADMARREEVARLLEACVAMAPLRGIIHAAGVLDDGMILHQSSERLLRVLEPKACGAWHLHELTRQHALDFFVAFSSVAGVLGNAGQSNYAAANAVLDALMQQRQSQGLPALSLSWGPWAVGGMAAALDSQHQRRLAELGFAPIAPEEGSAALEYALSIPGVAHLVAAPIDWNAYSAHYPGPLIRHLATAAPARPIQPETIRQRLEAALPAARHKLLSDHVRQIVGRVLGHSGSQASIGPRQGFFDLGLDSLGSIEIRNALQQSLAESLPATIAFDYPSIEELSTYLLASILPATGDTQPDVADTTPDIAAVSALSEEEAEAQLQAELDKLARP